MVCGFDDFHLLDVAGGDCSGRGACGLLHLAIVRKTLSVHLDSSAESRIAHLARSLASKGDTPVVDQALVALALATRKEDRHVAHVDNLVMVERSAVHGIGRGLDVLFLRSDGHFVESQVLFDKHHDDARVPSQRKGQQLGDIAEKTHLDSGGSLGQVAKLEGAIGAHDGPLSRSLMHHRGILHRRARRSVHHTPRYTIGLRTQHCRVHSHKGQ